MSWRRPGQRGEEARVPEALTVDGGDVGALDAQGSHAEEARRAAVHRNARAWIASTPAARRGPPAIERPPAEEDRALDVASMVC